MTQLNHKTIIQVSSYYPPRVGGMENVVQEIAQGLAGLGNETLVYTSNLDTTDTPDATPDNLQIRRLWGVEIAHTAIVPGIFFALLRVPRDSIIHIHTPRPFVTELAVLAAKIRRIPYVIEVHSEFSRSGFFGFLIPVYKKLFWAWSAMGASSIIFLAHEHEERLSHQYSLKRTTVIPNGVGPQYYFEKNPSRVKNPRLLYVGRLSAEKNLSFLIEAMACVTQECVLDIVGSGLLYQDLANLISAKHLGSKVALRGQRTGPELLDFYRSATAYVMPSLAEGLSLSMLEAMAASLPVVGFDTQGVTEHIKDVGVMVRDQTPQAFAAGIDQLLSDNQRYVAISRASHEYAKGFAWSRIIPKFDDLYSKVLSARQ